MIVSRRPRAALVVALTLGVVCVALIGVLATRTPALDKQARSPLLGRPAPAAGGTDVVTGRPASLTAMRGRFVLVNFFASWCVPCRREHPELARFTARHAGGDAAVLGVVFDDTAGAARDFLSRNGALWPVIDDPSGRIALDWGVRGPPESYLVSPEGTVLAKFIGGVTADGLDRVLARVRGPA